MELYEGLRGWMNGMAVPMLVLDAPGGGGKVPIVPSYIEQLDERARRACAPIAATRIDVSAAARARLHGARTTRSTSPASRADDDREGSPTRRASEPCDRHRRDRARARLRARRDRPDRSRRAGTRSTRAGSPPGTPARWPTSRRPSTSRRAAICARCSTPRGRSSSSRSPTTASIRCRRDALLRGRIARYARGEDYHLVMRDKLVLLADRLARELGRAGRDAAVRRLGAGARARVGRARRPRLRREEHDADRARPRQLRRARRAARRCRARADRARVAAEAALRQLPRRASTRARPARSSTPTCSTRAAASRT